MKLQRIKLSGFKSFVDTTNIEINGNLIGIVGPNGCGKSNIIDAVRWVLGESSASKLRGESMQNVIFNGTKKRKPVSRASVELEFDNSAKLISGIWSTYNEISIKRQVTRNGESLYYINNQQVRRRDITELFLSTVLGTKGYTVIEQGMVTKIIDAKPEELRLYLEEVAGISKYKEKRRETLANLQATRDNLVRIEDINVGLEKQVEDLTEQAKDAKKYRELQERVKLNNVILNLLKISKSDTILKELDESFLLLNSKYADFDLLVESCDLELKDLFNSKTVQEDKIASLTEEFNILRTEIAKLGQRRDYNKSLYERTIARRSGLQRELEEIAQKIKDAAKQISEFSVTIENNHVEIEKKQLTYGENLVILDDVEVRHKQLIIEVHDWSEKITSKKYELDILHLACEHKKQQLNTLKSRLNKLEQERLEHTSSFDQAYLLLKDKIAELELKFPQIENELLTNKKDRDDLNLRINSSTSALYVVKSEISVAKSKLLTINELLDKQDTGVSVAELGIIVGKITPLWQSLVVSPSYELAVQVVLGNILNSLYIEDIELISQEPKCLATFWVNSVKENMGVDKNVGEDTLDKFVEVQDERFFGVYNILSQYIVCSNFFEGVRKIKLLENSRILIVTKDGHLITRDYAIFNANSLESHILEYKNQATELENVLTKLAIKKDKLEDELNHDRGTLVKYDHDIAKLERLLNQCKEQKYKLQLQFTKEEQAFVYNKNYYEKSTQEYNLLKIEIENRSNELNRAIADLDDGKTFLSSLEEQYGLILAKKEDISTKYNFAKTMVDKLVASINRIITENNLIKQQLQSTELLIADKKDRVNVVKAEISSLEGDLSEIEQEDCLKELSLMQEEIAIKANDIEVHNAKKKELLEFISKIKGNLAKYTKEKDQINAKLNQLNLKKQEHNLLIISHKENLEKIGYENMDGNIVFGQESRSIHEIQQEISVISSQIESLGLVNLKAIENLEVVNARYNENKAREADLKDAVQMLESAVRKIDDETSSMFLNAYNKVNEGFALYFKTLFGGGNANLEITEKDILESGLLIFAEPPGKKHSSIQLLSGGEKALTAMSLIFAFFNLNPSPFCLLDEVDAPLDDVNTSRFCDLVREMAYKTQFIYISHNRLAMEMADQLLGVTMQENGVSTTVAISLVESMKYAV